MKHEVPSDIADGLGSMRPRRHLTPLPPLTLATWTGTREVDVLVRTTERLPHGEPIDVSMTDGSVAFEASCLTVVGSLSTWPHTETRYRLRCVEVGSGFDLAINMPLVRRRPRL